MIKIALIGVTGKMGRQILSLISSTFYTKIDLVCCVSSVGNIDIQYSSIDSIALANATIKSVDLETAFANKFNDAEIIIDFSLPHLTNSIIKYLQTSNQKFISGVTGLSDEQIENLKKLSYKNAILYSSNMSLGMNLVFQISKMIASVIGHDSDIEIFERHHNQKIDAPSGTAISIGQYVADGLGVNFNDVATFPNEQTRINKRKKGSIGFSYQRGGAVIGDHELSFFLNNEVISLTHKSLSRSIYAEGAINAALWLVNKNKGFYTMLDILDIKS